jgi:cysteine-rich repeat protein
VEFGEECDGTFGCSDECRLFACGNGRLDPGEECDDANSLDNDGCTSCKYNLCGDGQLFVGVEECDLGADNGTPGASCDVNCRVAP